ncbi:hypothetical protein GBA52_014713 [Prunus armeniaca]|nr:hypothetical protein GBA52_014713 [Prunus armeniaca]
MQSLTGLFGVPFTGGHLFPTAMQLKALIDVLKQAKELRHPAVGLRRLPKLHGEGDEAAAPANQLAGATLRRKCMKR